MIIDTWEGCYPSAWKGLIVPDAMLHPAKFSSKLIRHIYEHIAAEGWVVPGDVVVDPFGGVSLGALEAMRLGLSWRGVELEGRFTDLGYGYDCPGFTKEDWKRFYSRSQRVNFHHGFHWCPDCASMAIGISRVIPEKPPHRYHGNIDLWNSRYSTMPHWCGDAVCLRGDSRELANVLDLANAAVSSPPWIDTLDDALIAPEDRRALAEKMGISNSEHVSPIDMERIGKRVRRGYSGDKLASSVVSSPPYADGCVHEGGDDTKPENIQGTEIRLPGIAGAISSPPYAETTITTNRQFRSKASPNRPPAKDLREDGGSAYSAIAVSSPPYSEAHIGQKSGQEHCGRGDQYSSTRGQLGAMKANGFDAAVSSPPFENNLSHDGRGYQDLKIAKDLEISRNRTYKGSFLPTDYGHVEGNIGNDSGMDFWLAARQIVDQVYQVLAPGGHAVWVVKDFVKDKARVPFCDQWRQLCEAAGFVTLHEHHALLVKDKGTNHTLDGGTVHHTVESKSFFRRLAEKNGSPRIDYEVVFCMVKES